MNGARAPSTIWIILFHISIYLYIIALWIEVHLCATCIKIVASRLFIFFDGTSLNALQLSHTAQYIDWHSAHPQFIAIHIVIINLLPVISMCKRCRFYVEEKLIWKKKQKKNSKTEQRMSFEYFHFHERFAINIPHLYVYAAVFIYGIHLKLNVMHKIECKIRRKLSTRTCDCICLVWINPAFNVSMLCICCCFILRICSFISGWWVSSIDKIQPGI